MHMERISTAKAKRAPSVLQALEWAFAQEHASIDFDDNGSGAARVGVSAIWLMMQRGQLGCKIDGGGHSRCHDDADVIAAILEAMPVELGGKAMAVQVARPEDRDWLAAWERDQRTARDIVEQGKRSRAERDKRQSGGQAA